MSGLLSIGLIMARYNYRIEGIGEKLSKLRIGSGFYQREVAKHLGVDHSFISMFERGTRIPSVRHLIKMCQLFEVPIANVVGETI